MQQGDLDALRPLCYPGTDVFLVCFSVVQPASFSRLRRQWLDEVRLYDPKAVIVLVGLQCDLRTDVNVLLDLAAHGQRPVTEKEGRARARSVGAAAYFECSALTQRNLKEVFDAVITLALNRPPPPPPASAAGAGRTSSVTGDGRSNTLGRRWGGGRSSSSCKIAAAGSYSLPNAYKYKPPSSVSGDKTLYNLDSSAQFISATPCTPKQKTAGWRKLCCMAET